MRAGSAPSALRRPISFVRSETDTSIMFMMPMPPTRSAMDAMPPSIACIMALVVLIDFIRLSILKMLNALSASLKMPFSAFRRFFSTVPEEASFAI